VARSLRFLTRIMDLAPEMRIRRQLVLVRSIGEGGMASVWVADDLARGRRVAVKVLCSHLVGNDDVVERFTAEARALARIRSPFVPRVYDRGALADGTPFIVMEWMDGVDLDTYLRAHGPLSLQATARLVAHVAAALEAAHRIGIVHRDVKAENIFIQGSGDEIRAKLFDFGIAKIPFDRRRTQVGTLMGTPSYMSPEQLVSPKDVDERADLWSLGVVAYLVLTGKLPFEGETFGAVCVSIHSGDYEPPSQLVPGLPVEVDAWMAKALSTSPAARFQTAAELSDSLDTLAQDRCARPHGLPILVDDDSDELARTLVGGVSRTRRIIREPRRGLLVGLAAIGAAFIAYATPPAYARGWPSRATAVWAALTNPSTPIIAPQSLEPVTVPTPAADRSPPPNPAPAPNACAELAPPQPAPSTSAAAATAPPSEPQARRPGGRHEHPRSTKSPAVLHRDAGAEVDMRADAVPEPVAPAARGDGGLPTGSAPSDESWPSWAPPDLPVGFGSRD
jgi:eukaryotic-like serine/threonine-protein kinase